MFRAPVCITIVVVKGVLPPSPLGTSSVVTRMEEKKVAVLHPEALKQGDRPETRGLE